MRGSTRGAEGGPQGGAEGGQEGIQRGSEGGPEEGPEEGALLEVYHLVELLAKGAEHDREAALGGLQVQQQLKERRNDEHTLPAQAHRL
eukprot:5091325-Pyramimonas_sp.AAC.1